MSHKKVIDHKNYDAKVLASYEKTSWKIRYLWNCGYIQHDIAAILKIRPQHVSNVIHTHVKTVSGGPMLKSR